jgi:hypothetical protein
MTMTRALVIAVAWLAGCNLVFGVDEPELVHGTATTASTGTTTSNAASGGSGGAGGMAQGGGGAAGQGQGGDCADDPQNNCWQCCVQAHDAGSAAFTMQVVPCLCDETFGGAPCNRQCAAELCQGNPPSSSVCLICVQDQLQSGASGGCTLEVEACALEQECANFMGCVLGC